MSQTILLVLLLALPTAAAAFLGLRLWFGVTHSERLFSGTAAWTLSIATVCALALGGSLLFGGQTGPVDVGSWFTFDHHAFEAVFVADWLSVTFAVFSTLLVGLIGAFSRRYLHRETGFFRFYFLLMVFAAGVNLVVLAGTLDLVFVGWELVGLTSALLIAFFHERRKPVEHGFRAFLTYRLCDIGLLMAVVWLHHSVGDAYFTASAASPWIGIPVPVSSADTMIIGLLIVMATLGKAAQAPVGGWLPRAMEGPTPSSAIFYGAISIHLGPFLLLRAIPLIEASRAMQIAVIAVGATTALHATFVGRVQSDIKSALAYASMTQVGLIFVEIGFGFRYLALIHIVGHAAMRSLQILRSPSLLHDHHHMEQAMGEILPHTGAHLERLVPNFMQPWLYRHALERGYFDAILRDWVIGGPARLLRAIDRGERRAMVGIAGAQDEHPVGAEQ